MCDSYNQPETVTQMFTGADKLQSEVFRVSWESGAMISWTHSQKSEAYRELRSMAALEKSMRNGLKEL